ncbi:MAG: peptide ABC transporter permease [Beijerinckiaceae bacterium]
MNADPAEQAALLLFRIGFAITSILLPITAVFSRRALVVVAPIGAIVMVAATLMMPGQALGAERIRRKLLGPAGIAAGFLLLWSAISLLWTPFPAAGAERLFRVAGSAALAIAAIAALPPRMRASNLYLPAIGVGTAGLLALGVAFGRPKAVDPLAVERAAVLITLMAWPAVTWLSMKRRVVPAMAIAAGVGALALVLQGVAILPALMVGAVLLGGAINNLRGASTAFVAAIAVLILGGPLIALMLSFLAPQESGFGRTMQVWSDIIVADPSRLLTGHGVETALRNRISQLLDPEAPKSLLFEVWYELGLLGALAATVLLAFGTLAIARLGRAIAPFALGCMGFAFALSVIGLGTSQTWWITALAATSILFAAVVNGEYRTERPVAVPGG